MAETQPPRSEKAASRPGESGSLESFLASIDGFVTEVTALAAETSPDNEHRLLIRSSGDSLVGQTTKLTAYIRESATRLSAPQRNELDQFLRVQDGEALANRTVEVAKQVLKGGTLGKLLHWLAQHFKELKKFILEILHFIFDLLHLHWPSWLDRLIQILDQLLDLILRLLGEVFGLDFSVTAKQLSDQEVNFQRELASFEMVRAAQRDRGSFADEG